MASAREDLCSDHLLPTCRQEEHSLVALDLSNNAVPSSSSTRNDTSISDPFADLPAELRMDILARLTTPHDIYGIICASRAMCEALMVNDGFRKQLVRTLLAAGRADLETYLKAVSAAVVLLAVPLCWRHNATMADWKSAFLFLWWWRGLQVRLCFRGARHFDLCVTGMPQLDSVVDQSQFYVPRLHWKPWVSMLGKYGLITGGPCW